MMIVFQILIAWLLADLLTGVIHWFEDRYMTDASLNFLTAVAAENDLHHRKPTAMLISSGWTNMKSGAAIGWPIAILLFLLGIPWWICLVPFFAAFGNLIHRFAHTPKRDLPVWIVAMQSTGLFIGHSHHDGHHRAMDRLTAKQDADERYCPMTNWVNPVLDRTRFWRKFEAALRFFGLKTTAETQVAE